MNNNNNKLREKQKAILRAIRDGNQDLFNYIEDQKYQDSLLDIVLDDDYNEIKDFNDAVQNLLKEIFRLFKEDEADLSNIPAIIEKIMPLLIQAEESFNENVLLVTAGGDNIREEEEKKAPLPREERPIDQLLYQMPKFNPVVDPPKRIEKGPYQRPNVENIESKEIADILCVCEYDFEELEKFINEERGIKEKLKHFILKKLINLKSRNPHKIAMRGDLKKYQIVEDINIADELGEWRFHPFFDKMAVYLVRQEDKDFPIKWHVPRDFADFQIKTKERESLERVLSEGNITLLSFLEDLAEKHDKDKKQAEIWAEILNGQAVDTVEELLKWEKKDFDELKSIPKQIKLVLQQELNKFKFKGMSETQANLNEAERRGIVHKIRRFLYYHAGEADKLGYINQEVLKLALDEVKTYYEGDSLLNQIKTFYLGYSVPMKKKGNIILERGMILHGPPGTGKTVLTDDLPLKMGLTPISHSLSASEVNRGIVGQTEKLLLDLCNRATKMPHLLCCVSIDEIDGLVPKRDEKSSQHKTDGIAVLLAVIGGIKDVPNLVFLASTNRLNQIDDAIKRRLSGQFFVGRPSPASRRKLIQRVNDEKAEDGSQLVILNDQEVEETVKMTTNFSGAALKMLVSKLLVYYKTLKGSGKLDLAEITEYATLTSKQFSIKLGTFYLPELFLKRIEDKKRGVKEDMKAQCTIKVQKFMSVKPESRLDQMLAKTLNKPEEKKLQYEFTGRILVNLSDIRKTHIEYQLKEDFQILIEERDIMASTLNDLLPRFADFVAERNIDYIQLFNSDFLLDNNAFDESKIMENINEKLQELGAYDRSLLIIDMDSLCGVNMSKSESGMGPTTSYSLSNAKLFNFGIHSISTKVQMTEKKEVWIALACKNSYLLNIAKQSLNWRKSPKQIEEENQEKEDNTHVKICKRCDQKYLEVENKLGSCSYHDGFLFQSSQPSNFWAPLEDEVKINALKAHPKVNELGLKYICCMDNYTSQGCKKDKHSHHGHSLANYYDKFVALKRSN